MKPKMLRIFVFYNIFSILGQDDLSEWVPDGPEPPWTQDLAQHAGGWILLDFFLQEA